jgi:hypothetical protein
MARIPTSRFSFYLKIIKRFAPYLLSRLKVLADALDIRDFILLGGLGMLGYGLYLLDPWIAFTVCGALLVVLSILMRARDGHSKQN